MTLEEQYQAAYRRAMNAMDDIQHAIHDLPGVESESLTWSTLADMQRIATDLEQITRYAR